MVDIFFKSVAMLGDVAPSSANKYMVDFEGKFICIYEEQLIFYERYLEELVSIWTYGEQEPETVFASKWNNCQETIKFTNKLSSVKIYFLDTT